MYPTNQTFSLFDREPDLLPQSALSPTNLSFPSAEALDEAYHGNPQAFHTAVNAAMNAAQAEKFHLEPSTEDQTPTTVFNQTIHNSD